MHFVIHDLEGSDTRAFVNQQLGHGNLGKGWIAGSVAHPQGDWHRYSKGVLDG
jgi:hypothetical protein